MKSSLHSLIPFLPSPWTPISRPRTNSRQQLTQMNSSSTELSQLITTNSNDLPCPFMTPWHEPRSKTQPLYCLGGLLTDPLPSNGRPIVAHVGSSGNVFTESLPSNSLYVYSYRLVQPIKSWWGGGIHRHREHGDYISLFLVFLNTDSRLKIVLLALKMSCPVRKCNVLCKHNILLSLKDYIVVCEK
jgi:hypothetical protein